MNAIINKKSAVIVILVFTCFQTSAQNYSSKYEFGIATGTLVYQGDLTPAALGSYKDARPSFQIFASKNLDNNFALRANFTRGHISGNDAWYSTPAYHQLRNFNFNTTVNELSASLVWNFYNYNAAGTQRKLSAYIFGGAGLSFVKINRDWSKLNTAAMDPKSSLMTGLAVDTVHKLPGIIPVIPLGVGVRYAVSQNLSLFAEGTYRITFSDYLDGFSKSVNPSSNDYYYGISVGIVYHLSNNGLRCPRIKR